ncbi:MAG: hypothetical protein HY268_27020, partial [Deltaproteobacteria bacterium]|nr:hypothetical protein [Deltaproteobacteria bacterium]
MNNTLFKRSRIIGFLLAVGLTALGLLPLPYLAYAASPPVFVQKKLIRVTAGGSVSVTFTKPNTAGNLIVAYVVWDNSGAVSLTDSRGNTYVSAIGPTQASSDPSSVQIFYASNISGGTNTVTAHFATAITSRGVLYVYEYAGIERTAPLDAAVAASGASSAMDSGVLTTTGMNELLFMGAESNGKAIKFVTHGYRPRSNKYGNRTADQIAATAGAYSAQATQKGTAWVMQLVAFKPFGSTSP